MYSTAAKYSIVEESRAFIEVFINYFGMSHPSLSAYSLARWAGSLKLTDDQRSERKKIAEELIKKIDLVGLSVQSLAILSTSEAFPELYMLKQIQKRAELNHISPLYISDKVVYSLSMKVGRIVELEFGSNYL